jgi:hypothetical protein
MGEWYRRMLDVMLARSAAFIAANVVAWESSDTFTRLRWTTTEQKALR